MFAFFKAKLLQDTIAAKLLIYLIDYKDIVMAEVKQLKQVDRGVWSGLKTYYPGQKL